MSQLWISEGRLGLDPRVVEGVKPELFFCQPQQHRRNDGAYDELAEDIKVRILCVNFGL